MSKETHEQRIDRLERTVLLLLCKAKPALSMGLSLCPLPSDTAELIALQNRDDNRAARAVMREAIRTWLSEDAAAEQQKIDAEAAKREADTREKAREKAQRDLETARQAADKAQAAMDAAGE